MSTKAQLTAATLRHLKVVDAIENPSATDAALVESIYDSKHAEWRRLGHVWWVNTGRDIDEIPGEVRDVLKLLMSNASAAEFGLGGSPLEQRGIESQLLRQLKALNHKPPSGEETWSSAY